MIYMCVFYTVCMMYIVHCVVHYTHTDIVHCKSWRLPSPEFQVSIDCWGGGPDVTKEGKVIYFG